MIPEAAPTMPTYEYRCPQEHHFEMFQRISDVPEATCPECGEPSQRQISGGAGFLFKGDGFYKTDYRSEDYKKKASSEQSAAESSKSTESTVSKDAGSGSSSEPPSSKPSPSD